MIFAFPRAVTRAVTRADDISDARSSDARSDTPVPTPVLAPSRAAAPLRHIFVRRFFPAGYRFTPRRARSPLRHIIVRRATAAHHDGHAPRYAACLFGGLPLHTTGTRSIYGGLLCLL